MTIQSIFLMSKELVLTFHGSPQVMPHGVSRGPPAQCTVFKAVVLSALDTLPTVFTYSPPSLHLGSRSIL